MPLSLLHTDITQFPCDALVLSTDESLRYGGSVFGAVCSAAGPSMSDLLRKLAPFSIGTAQAVPDAEQFDPEARNLIVTAAPTWQDGKHGETEQLAACYHSSLKIAAAMRCKRVGISLIDSGVYGFPKELAREIAVQALLNDPHISELDVFLLTFDWSRYNTHMERARQLERYLNLKYCKNAKKQSTPFRERSGFGLRDATAVGVMGRRPSFFTAELLDERLKQLDEGFTEMLLRKIDEAGIKDSECYKRANVSKQLFSKIRSNPHYRPKKETVIAFALALELNLDDTNALLQSAGYSLSHSSKFDVIIEYFISKRIYDVFEINEALYMYDQPILGSE